MSKKVMITGEGAICAAGKDPDEIWKAARAGRSAIDAIQQWDSSNWPSRLAGEIADLNPRALVEDRKLHKLVRRTDLLGLYAASKAIEDAGLIPHRDALDPAQADLFNDRTGVYVGGGGGAYQDQYDYFPLLTAARGDLGIFGRQLATTVNPMWLLRTLPNNVLCHIGIRYAFKGPNACITNHPASGMLAVAEAAAALRAGEADRAVARGRGDRPGRRRDDRGPRKRHPTVGRVGGIGNSPYLWDEAATDHGLQVGLRASLGRLRDPRHRIGPRLAPAW